MFHFPTELNVENISVSVWVCSSPGATVFAREGRGLWSRARVLEVFQSGCVEAVDVCPAGRLDRLRLFFLDSGLGKSLDIHR